MGKLSARNTSTKLVENALKKEYIAAHPHASVTAYQYNSASIRVRVLDRDFDGLSIEERETEILPIIQKLPEHVQEQVTMLLLLTPRESKRSLLSDEFDDPRPSRL